MSDAKPPGEGPFEGTMELSSEAVFAAVRAAIPFQRGSAPEPSSAKADKPDSPFERTMVLSEEPDRPSWDGTLDLTAVAPAAPVTPFQQSAASLEERFGGTMDLTDADIVSSEAPATARLAAPNAQAASEMPFVVSSPSSSPAPSAPIPGAPWASVPAPKAPKPAVDLEQTLAIEPGDQGAVKPIRPIMILGTHPREPIEEEPPSTELPGAIEAAAHEATAAPNEGPLAAMVVEPPREEPLAAMVVEAPKTKDVWAAPVAAEAPPVAAPPTPLPKPLGPDRTVALYAKFRGPKDGKRP